MSTQLSDKEILSRLYKGDKQAFERLFRAWYGPMVVYALRIVPDKMEAESIAQAVFLKLWEKRRELRIRSLNNYLKVAVRNRCMNFLRGERKHLSIDDHLLLADEEGEDELPDAQLLEKLNQAIAQMPPQRQKIFKMSRFEGYKYKEIADCLELSPKTVEAQMGKALKYLRALFNPSAVNFHHS